MDPLSVSASIIAVLELTATLMKYVNSVRKAPKERAQIAQEASNMYALLTSLRFRVEGAQSSDPWFTQVRMLAAPNGALAQLETIVARLATKAEASSKLKDLVWKFTKAEIEEALGQIERLKSLVGLALANDLFALSRSIKIDVGEVVEKLDRLRAESKAVWPSELSSWLDIPDTLSNYAAACKQRQARTGSWLLHDRRFVKWKDSPGSSLWLHGIAGSGKTVLTATVIDQVSNTAQSGVAYFYFDFNDNNKRNLHKCIRSLVVQLARQVPGGIQEVRGLYRNCQDGQLQPQDSALFTVMSRLIQSLAHCYIIFDALDESDNCQELLEFIKNLTQCHQSCLHFLATSRRERELEECLRPMITAEVAIQAAVVDADINIYVEELLKNDIRLRKWPTDVRKEIQQTITDKSNGMFRWASCQMDTVRKCIKLSALRQVLSSLPKTLYETYDRILSTIERNGQLDDAVRILQWLCFAKRPQSLKSLVDVLATDIGGNGRFLVEERLPDPFDIITVCSSLISIKEETDSRYHRGFLGPQLVPEDPIIQLAHFSVQEYLLSDRCFVGEYFSLQNGHSLLAEISLVYTLHVCTEFYRGGSYDFDDLSDSEVEGPVEKAVQETKRWLSFTYHQYPLSRYTSAWWFKHTSEISATASSQRVIEMSIHLFENTDVLARWLKLHDPNPFLQNKSRFQNVSVSPLRHFGQIDTEPRQSHIASPVFYAAATGLPLAVEQLVARGNDVNQMSDQYPAPLHVAVLKGDVSTAASILSNGGNVDARNAVAGTPLQIASASGDNLAMVKLLISVGATLLPGPSNFTFVNPYDGRLSHWYGTTLDAACYGGSLEILRTLLEAGETVHAPILPKSLLDVVTVGRQHATYQELIVQGQSHIRRATVLHATERSNVETKFPEDRNLTERPDSSQDYNAVVRLLLSNGLELNEGPWNTHKPADKGFFVLLSEARIQATKLGDWDEMLCIFGLDSNGPGAFDKLLRFALQTNQPELLDVMLHFALHRNRPELFNKLLTHGADITSVDEYGRNCIDYTAAFPKILQRFNIPSDKCEPTNPEGRKEILYETTLRNIGKLLWFTSGGTFLNRRQLGRSLIHLGWLKDAVSAFQLLIPSDGGPGTRLRHLVACDGCGDIPVETTLRVCRSCKDADLCDPCYKLYQAGLLRNIYLCHGHDFLEVPLMPFCKEYTQSSLTLKVRDWLLELEEKIRRELPVAGSRMIAGEEQKPSWTAKNPWISMQSFRSLRRDCYD